jgi:hypothetical protein
MSLSREVQNTETMVLEWTPITCIEITEKIKTKESVYQTGTKYYLEMRNNGPGVNRWHQNWTFLSKIIW